MTLQNELSPTSTLDQNDAPETVKGETSMPPETILVVDDNRQIANFLSTQLLPQLGYHSLVAYSGKEALRVLDLSEENGYPENNRLRTDLIYRQLTNQ